MFLFFLNEVSETALFFGRFHPLIVHMPIGFLIIGFLLEVYSRRKKNFNWDGAIEFTLLLSAISAVMSCIMGWLLSLSGDYDPQALNIHKWMGICLAIFSIIIYFLKIKSKFIPFSISNRFYMPGFISAMILLTVTGHFGGNLTHGSDYLTMYMPSPIKKLTGASAKNNMLAVEIPKDPNQVLAYKHIIEPVLQQKCFSCHNNEKQKGNLRMDLKDLFLKGGKHGKVLISGQAEKSEIFKRVILPAENEEHMPPKGKVPLSEEEIALLKWWIDQGADFNKKVLDIPAEENIKKTLAIYIGGAQSNTSKKESEVFNSKIAPPDNNKINELRRSGLIITPLLNGGHFLEVSFVNAGSKANELIPSLVSFEKQIVWLKLGFSNISDQQMINISKLKNVVRLGLEHTNISDVGLKGIKNFKYLEYLNLYGTNVTDEGLKQLEGLKNLQNLYVWQTNVTENGIIELKKKIPKLEVDFGWKEPDSNKVTLVKLTK